MRSTRPPASKKAYRSDKLCDIFSVVIVVFFGSEYLINLVENIQLKPLSSVYLFPQEEKGSDNEDYDDDGKKLDINSENTGSNSASSRYFKLIKNMLQIVSFNQPI